MNKILDDVNDKIEKLWELLESHTKELERSVKVLKMAVKLKNSDDVGQLAGQIEVIATSDVCYATTIEVLEDLKRSKT